jgi:hypothetical protein
MKGEVVERLIENKDYHYMGASSPSRSGKKILYTTNYNPPSPDPVNITKEQLSTRLFPKESLCIMNYESRKVEFTINDFSRGGMLDFNESPWSPDEKKFVYTIRKKPKVNLEGKPLNKNDTVIAGAYIFDIEKQKDIKFIPGATAAIWSPNSNIIAYLKNDNVWLYDVDADTHILFLKSTSPLTIEHIHWTPEGDHLYMLLGNENVVDEKLYRLKDGIEIPFKKLHLLDRSYTWR